MQIAASSLSLSSQAVSYRRQETRQAVEAWTGGRRPAAQTAAKPIPAADPGGLFRGLSRAAKARPADDGGQGLDPESERILLILEKLFGMKGARSLVHRLKAAQQATVDAQAQGQQAQDGGGRAGWGLRYDATTTTVSVQSASLVAEGTLKLADGTALAFHLDWSQTSLQVQQTSTHLALGDARLSDPLAIDLDGNGLAFSGSMGLMLGGSAPATVARPAGGDALLVRDADGDGTVDADEVLGAATGKAFAELTALDDDGNGWVDQGDAAWSQLRLLDGSGALRPLDGSVGAIATASVALPYEHRDEGGALQAVGRRGGVAMSGDGRALAVGQVDFVV